MCKLATAHRNVPRYSTDLQKRLYAFQPVCVLSISRSMLKHVRQLNYRGPLSVVPDPRDWDINALNG
jgi:hypothetical protein